MQHWFALSDPGMEDALYEIESMRHFAGIKLNAVPDETAILNFRRFIEDNDLSIDILDKINQHLARKGLLLKTGTVVTTAANEADVSIAEELLHGKEQTVHADAGYTGADKLYRSLVGTSPSNAAGSRRWLKASKRTSSEQKSLPRPASVPGWSIRFTRSNASLAIPRPGSRGWPTSQVVLLFALVNLHRVRKKLMAIKERHEWWKFKAEVRLKTA